ncbi:Uncharacterized protein APZ42_010745, partial [Daphnia magna]
SVVRKFLNPSRKVNKAKLRGVDNKPVRVEGSLPLNVKWGGKLVKINHVTVLRTAPFALILGVDWIVKSNTSIVVKRGRIELVGEGSKIFN